MANKRAATSRPGAGRFTLVEVLIVVAIIAILMSLLAPSLRKSMERAKDLACQNNMRQLGMVEQAYCNDNYGFTQLKSGGTSGWQGKLMWPDRLMPYVYPGITLEVGCYQESITYRGLSFKVARGIFNCASLSMDDRYVLGTTWERYRQYRQLGIGMNQALNGGKKIVKVRNPGATLMFTDLRGYHDTTDKEPDGCRITTDHNQVIWYKPDWMIKTLSKRLPNEIYRHGDHQMFSVCTVDGAVRLIPWPLMPWREDQKTNIQNKKATVKFYLDEFVR
ncbi:MAG: prepilin-type N-terminal cleavage/methylation domain-containing protein [Planctomycetes bacterium]|nr:prepilin-type N-terminal cleavage/methylation domain-containing protein [Planctomycetota bacterium]